MKSKIMLVGVVLAALIMSSVGLVSAQAPTAFYVGFQIQNLSATNAATVAIQYYKQDGTGNGDSNYSQTISIPAGRSKTILCNLSTDLSADILAPAPAVRGSSTFVGSVIISSDQEVAAIANEAASVSNPYGAASYDGVSSGQASATVYAPLISKIGQPDTAINIQNPNGSSVSVVVQYVPGVYGVAYTAPAASLPAYGSAIWAVPASALDGSGRFLGSAKITSTGGNVAVIVDEIYTAPGTARHNGRQSYNGFSSGSTKAVAPLIQKNDSGVWYTGLQVVNLGPGSATVRVTYNGTQGTISGSSCNPTTPVSALTETDFALAENGSKTILAEQGGALNSVALASLGCFRGAASVEVVGGTGKVAAIVSVAGKGVASLAAYRAFDPTIATQTVSVPLIEKYVGTSGNYGWSTGTQVANLGTGTATITGTFSVSCGGTPTTITDVASGVSTNSSATFLQLNGFATGSFGTNKQCLGSATFTSNQNIGAIVQQSFFGSPNPFTGDTLMAFEAFNR